MTHSSGLRQEGPMIRLILIAIFLDPVPGGVQSPALVVEWIIGKFSP